MRRKVSHSGKKTMRSIPLDRERKRRVDLAPTHAERAIVSAEVDSTLQRVTLTCPSRHASMVM